MNGRPKRASRRPAKLMECRYVSYCRKLTADVRFLIAIPNHPSIKHGWTAEPSRDTRTRRLPDGDVTVHFAVSHFAVSHYLTLTLTLILPLGSEKRQNRKRRNGKSRIRFVVATFTPRSSHISNARFTHSLLLASSLAAGRRSAPRDRYTAICYCASIRC